MPPRFTPHSSLAIVLLLACAATTFADQPRYLTAEPGGQQVKRFDVSGAFDGLLVSGPAGFTANHFCLGPEGRRLYVPTYLGINGVRIYDVETGAYLGAIDHPTFVSPAWVGLAPDGMLVIADFDGARVWRYDLETDTFAGELVDPGHVLTAHSVIFNDDGTILVLDWWGGKVVRFRANGTFERVLYGGAALVGPLDMQPSPSGDRLYVANQSLANVVILDRATGAYQGVLVSAGSGGLANPEGMIYGHDGSLLITSPGSASIERYDAETGAHLGRFIESTGYPVDILFAPARCPSDVTNDGATDFQDALAVLSNWGACEGCPADVDLDGSVSFADLLALLAHWGPCDER